MEKIDSDGMILDDDDSDDVVVDDYDKYNSENDDEEFVEVRRKLK